MADDNKKTDKSNNNSGNADSNSVKPSSTAIASSNNSSGTTTPTWTKPTDTSADTKPTTSDKGGEKMAKDPEGMFDYSKCQTYTVKNGDTLFDVAQKFEVALQQLRYFNHLNKATWRIKEGQTLYVPTKPIHVPTGK